MDQVEKQPNYNGVVKQSNWHLTNGLKDLISGIIGGIALVGAGHPLDTIKVRLQTQASSNGGIPQFSGALDCALKTFKNEGFRGLYKGIISPLIGIPPIYAIVFGSYGSAKRFLTPIDSKPGESLALWRIFIAGCITGIATTGVTSPIELIKSRLQIQYLATTGAPPLYNGVFDCARKIFATEGIRGIFRGTIVTLWRDVPGTGAYFLSYEYFRRRLTNSNQSTFQNSMAILFSGGMGGICNWLAVFPTDVIKSRIQTSEAGKYLPGTRGIIQCGRELVCEGGPRALFKGLSPALVRSFPANACCFLAFELSMKILHKL